MWVMKDREKEMMIMRDDDYEGSALGQTESNKVTMSHRLSLMGGYKGKFKTVQNLENKPSTTGFCCSLAWTYCQDRVIGREY